MAVQEVKSLLEHHRFVNSQIEQATTQNTHSCQQDDFKQHITVRLKEAKQVGWISKVKEGEIGATRIKLHGCSIRKTYFRKREGKMEEYFPDG